MLDAIISIGKNLFFNSPMEACIIVCQRNKPKERKGKVLFIDARDWVVKDQSGSYLSKEHIQDIARLYHDYKNVQDRASIIESNLIPQNKDCALTVGLYVKKCNKTSYGNIDELINEWSENVSVTNNSLTQLMNML